MLPPTPVVPSPAAFLVDTLLDVHQQSRLSGLLERTAVAAAALGVTCHLAALLRDVATDQWYVTALLDAQGRPQATRPIGVPDGPFAFTPPPPGAPYAVDALFGASWGAAACDTLVRRLGATTALAAPIGGASGVQGALVALLNGEAGGAPVAGVLAHAALAAQRLVDGGPAPLHDAVLDQHTLEVRAGEEIARAARYHREVAVIVFEMAAVAAMGELGRMLVRGVRRWDMVGRPDLGVPTLAAVLPETGRGGARGLLRRLGRVLADVHTGVACFPDDGGSLNKLVEMARDRAGREAFFESRALATESQMWRRDGKAGPGMDSVRCPRCLVTYTRRLPAGLGQGAAERARMTAREAFQRDCPRHPDQVMVSA